jgi:hypothetical protein
VSRKRVEPSGSMLPLPLQFLAAWLAVWFQRALQKQVDYLTAEIESSRRSSATGN